MTQKRSRLFLSTLMLQFFIRTCLGDDCTEGALFNRIAFHKLEGFVIQRFALNDDFQCLRKCGPLPECLSLNIAVHPNEHGLYDCVLLRNETSKATGHLKPSQFYHHYSPLFLNRCDYPGMCKNGGTCVPLARDFSCRCLKGFNGKQCEKVICNSRPLGMESGTILDSSITASSSRMAYYNPSKARLNKRTYGWSPDPTDNTRWLQVDLSTVTRVTHIATQGCASCARWVKSYSLQYGLDGTNFQDYQGGRIFAGNNDQNSIVKHVIKPAIVARYIRVRPKTWKSNIALRIELYGCR